jgi:hypothetical protein
VNGLLTTVFYDDILEKSILYRDHQEAGKNRIEVQNVQKEVLNIKRDVFGVYVDVF